MGVSAPATGILHELGLGGSWNGGGETEVRASILSCVGSGDHYLRCPVSDHTVVPSIIVLVIRSCFIAYDGMITQGHHRLVGTSSP